MGILGRVEEFNNSNEDWPQYAERHFFVANGIDAAEKKRAVRCWRQYHKSLRNLVSPEKPGEKTYDVLVAALTKPAPSEIVERFKFHSRCCKPGESVEIFIVELRSLSRILQFRRYSRGDATQSYNQRRHNSEETSV
jgi:hypothetical protein